MTPVKFCPYAYQCVHPCDDDECFLETIEQPNGPEQYVTKEECEAFLRLVNEFEQE